MSRVGSPFRALWLAVFLFYLSFQLLVPVVPLYAVRLGASDVQLGLLTGLFAGTAMLLRPVVGQLTDSLGRRPLILLGSTIFAAAPLGYAAAGGLAALLALRVLHGSGMGFGQTAASVAAADLAPIARRGEALGVFGLASTFGIMLGPYAGIELYRRLGYPKAARFIDMMEQDRVIGPGDGAKPREVLVGPEYLARRGK